jgi:hypothetical protein
MRDLLGIAVAVLVGLLTLAFQAWSPQWWAGVIVSGGTATITASHLVWSNLPDWLKTQTGPASWTPDGKVQNGPVRAAIGFALLGIIAVFYVVKPPSSASFVQYLSRLVAAAPPNSLPPVTAPAPPSASPSNFSPNTWQSSEGKALLSCNVPPPPVPTIQQYQYQYQVYQNEMGGIGDALGINISVSQIRDGVRIDFEAVSDEGKERLWRTTGTNVTKFSLESRRVAQAVIVAFMADRPGITPAMQLQLLNTPIRSTKEDSDKFERSIEKMLGFSPGVCHLF